MPRSDRVDKEKAPKAEKPQEEQKEAKTAEKAEKTEKAGKAAAPKKAAQPKAKAGGKPAAKELAEQPAPAAPVVLEPQRLLQKYRQETAPVLTKEFKYSNPMEIPRLAKVVLNIGLSESLTNPKAQENAMRDLVLISGQQPVVTKAKKSIANFKLRANMPIGLKVTLRGRRMYEFLDKLINASLPRIRDFRGIPRTSGDGRGSFSLGLREQAIFPEIDYNQIDRMRGLQITIVTTARTNEECVRLLELLGMPFVKERIAATA